ncbi:MAG: hypothetical protein JNM85_10850 [Chthonomonas sp.]|nr:hypothetical protein [Chthonomonas sp.]
MIFPIVIGFVGMMLVILLLSLKSLIYLCQPNQVLIFSGSRTRVGTRTVGYRLIKGGRGLRRPFIERVDMLDLTNMIIELQAQNAYARGGIPLNVHGVANVKIAGHEPVLNNAIERFLGKSRIEVMQIARATLEGSLRGVLATLTPEQLNEDRNLFAEKLVQEVEQDMTSLGLVVDTLKIQTITDDMKYLDSIGRVRNAELDSSSRTAEAIAGADAKVRVAENMQQEVQTQILAQTSVAKAEATKMVTDALTRRAAVVAEEQAVVKAQVAKARAELEVQKARLEPVRLQLDADVVQPAKARCEAMEQEARAKVAPIIEDGKARAGALRSLAKSWSDAGDNARDIFILQKLESVIAQVTSSISPAKINQVTLIDSKGASAGGSMDPARLMVLNEQLKQMFGIDVVSKLQEMTTARPEPVAIEAKTEPQPVVEEPKPAPQPVTPPPKKPS